MYEENVKKEHLFMCELTNRGKSSDVLTHVPSVNFMGCEKENETIHKAIKYLEWHPKWNFEKTIQNTANWYFEVHKGEEAFNKCLENINEYNNY